MRDVSGHFDPDGLANSADLATGIKSYAPLLDVICLAVNTFGGRRDTLAVADLGSLSKDYILGCLSIAAKQAKQAGNRRYKVFVTGSRRRRRGRSARRPNEPKSKNSRQSSASGA
jgi:hypothetical protein